jgi:hypothetical protein
LCRTSDLLHKLITCRYVWDISLQVALSSAGINTGILLLRNDMDFSPKFWKDVAVVSRINQNVQRNSSTPEGQIKVRAAT